MRRDRAFAAISAVAVLLSFGVACSRPLASNTTAPGNSIITYEVKDGRIACCAFVDLGTTGHLAVGRVDYPDGRSRAWLARVGPVGERQWDHELTLPFEHSALTAGVVTRTLETYVVGWSVAPIRSRQELLVMKLRGDREPEWTRTSALRLDTKAEAAIVTADGAIVVAGFTRASGITGSVFVAGLNGVGEISWQWPVADAADTPWVSLLASSTGGYLVAGMFGITHLETDGRRRWQHRGMDVVRVVEDRAGDVYLMGRVSDRPEHSRTAVRKLSGRGDDLWTHALAGICTVPGSWRSPRGGLIVAGNPCETMGELWLTEVSAEGQAMGVTRLRLPADAQAYRAEATRDGHVIAAGGFAQETAEGKDHPDGLKAWIMKTARPVRYTK